MPSWTVATMTLMFNQQYACLLHSRQLSKNNKLTYEAGTIFTAPLHMESEFTENTRTVETLQAAQTMVTSSTRQLWALCPAIYPPRHIWSWKSITGDKSPAVDLTRGPSTGLQGTSPSTVKGEQAELDTSLWHCVSLSSYFTFPISPRPRLSPHSFLLPISSVGSFKSIHTFSWSSIYNCSTRIHPA